MKPEKLVLQNIGPFRGTHTVDFTALGDIFLVYGKTGAGKTTVFDAISFAFYGKVPGSRNGIERQMRSQFADDGDTASVSLVFTTGGKRYRIARTLAYEKIGARSGKIVPVQEESSLDEWVSGVWESRTSTNKSDTDRKILDIIKLSSEEFSRIVLLPQGEFARFLKLNSNERKDVLAKLFPVGQYTRVIELARNRAKEASLRVAETENAAVLLQKQFNHLSWKDDRSALEADITALRERQTSLRNEIGKKSALLEKARAADGRRAQERLLASKFASLEARIGEQTSKERALEDARRAEPLMAELVALEADQQRHSTLSEELAKLERELVDLGAVLAGLERAEGEMRAASKEKDSLLVRKDQLQSAVKIEEALESLEAEYDATKKELAAERKKLEALEVESANRSARLAELDGDIASMEERTKRHGAARDELEKQKAIRDLSQEYARELKARNAHGEAVARIESEIGRNRSDLAIAKSELTSLEKEAEAERDGELAASLAIALEEGKPCPVCGSLHHPSLAVKKKAPDFTLAQKIEADKRRCESLEADFVRLGEEKAARSANLATAGERLALIEAKAALPEAIPTPEEAGRSLEDAVRLTQEASDLLGVSRAALREAGEIRAIIARYEPEHARIRSHVAELELESTAEKTGIAHEKARYLEAFPKGSEGEDAAEELEKCVARILEIEAAISAHETKSVETRMRFSSLGGKKAEIERTLASLAKSVAEKESKFTEGCERASFADGNAVKKAALGTDAQKKLEADIASFNRERSETGAILDRVRAEISGWDGPESETVEAEIGETERGIEETGRTLEEKVTALSSLDGLKARWDSLEKERSERSIEGSRLKKLADDLTGNNPAKTSFDAWILGMYLEEITAYANDRLERMSDGRYRILLNDSYRKGNSLAGLELEILDAHTGKTRPTGTLSGGETFMTSISLALGLADSIQSRAGGIQLDAVFIDEGFGSLDESSLERAITILDEIRGSRMVGLISHVGELRNRIPNRIEIIKTGAGSEIRADAGDRERS